MRIARIFPAVAALAFLIVAQPALAEDGWFSRLNPFAAKEKETSSTIPVKRANVSSAEPSPLEKLSAGTKKFFAGARDALTWKKPAPKKTPTNQYAPWMRPSKEPVYPSDRNKKKKSWLDSLFRRKEPQRVESMKDFVGLPRLDY